MQSELISNKIFGLANRYKFTALIILTVVVLALIRLTQVSSYFLLFIFVLPLIFVLVRDRKIGFYLIVFWVFFADWFNQLGLIPTQLTWFPEIILLVYTLVFIYKHKSIIRTPIDIPVVIFIAIAVISAVYNAKSPIALLLALRLDLKFILMFYLLVNFRLSEKFYRNMIKLFLFLLLLQVPVAVIKYFIYGQGERAIGTYAAYGGTYSTLLPLIAISLFTALYLFKKQNNLYVLAIGGFILFSIVGGKKGLIYFGPVLVILIVLYMLASKNLHKTLRRFLPLVPLMLFMFIPILFFVTWLQPATKNPEYLRGFINIYDLQYTPEGNPAGRIPSNIVTYKSLSCHPLRFLLGYGPGSMMKSYFEQFHTRKKHTQPIWAEYGITESVQKPVEYGYVGFFIYFLLIPFLLFKKTRRFFNVIDDKYWRAISFGYIGILFTYFIIGIGYSAVLRSDLAGFIFWFFAAAVYSVGRQKQIFK